MKAGFRRRAPIHIVKYQTFVNIGTANTPQAHGCGSQDLSLCVHRGTVTGGHLGEVLREWDSKWGVSHLQNEEDLEVLGGPVTIWEGW